ncbi:MAG: hypothetical protein WBD20_21965 [Pirellulaceae bacterium]
MKSPLKSFCAVAALTIIAMPVNAFAHGGHGSSDLSSASDTAMHYLTQPEHASAIGAVLLCVGLAVATRYALARRHYS